jgi:deoxyribodipyrimidine photo-lyase
MIQEERIRALNRKEPVSGSYVLYWMQASQRTHYNHALAHAARIANERRQPLLVFFGLTEAYPGANLRHYRFMLEGLAEAQSSLAGKGIRMVVRLRSPEKGAVELSRGASLAVVDRGYLKLQRQWREDAAAVMRCPLIQVESNVVVPVEEASSKEEYSAATIRPRIGRQLERYLLPMEEELPVKSSLHLDIESLDLSDTEQVLARLNIDQGTAGIEAARGGTSQANARLTDFIDHKLKYYPSQRNDPSLDLGSGMSPYLHFGQISPLFIALEVQRTGGPGAEAYLEELIVRRELSMNFVYYNRNYDSLEGLPRWALKTLHEHASDPREYLYTLQELEEARTHDPYWNAAQKEMVATSRMHNYMRMYWGKKIIEWSATPDEAYRAAVYLNDKYELDGRDPNGYTGVLWCFGKHDRAWKERDVLGKLRYMSAGGLRRKFDIETYVRKTDDVYREYAG